MSQLRLYRRTSMALALVTLVAALWAGLTRLGWQLPRPPVALITHHGSLAISFLGAVIALERAVALRRPLVYLTPIITGVGAVATIIGLPYAAGPRLITSGSLGLLITSAWLMRRQPTLFTGVMSLGAGAWAVGNWLWLVARPIPYAVPWWMAFLILTIVAERLELARLRRLSVAARAAFALAVGLLFAACAVSVIAWTLGVRIAGGSMLALAAWLLRYDVARVTVRRKGVTRYIAVCMLSGYAWLIAAGLLALRYGGVMAGPRYDAALHAVFLGFVGSMVLGHAPIILPALADIRPPYHPGFYAALALLHMALVLRILGDVSGWWAGRQWGGLFNIVALLLFAAMLAVAMRQTASPLAPHDGAAWRRAI